LLDSLANRYKLLPSEVLLKADTLDVLVADAAISFYNHTMQQQQAKSENKAAPVDLPVSKLREILDRARSKDANKISK
jgi:hypothetical protein